MVAACPLKIAKVLTNNCSEFSDRYVHGCERKPTGKHAFDRVCIAHDIEHRTAALSISSPAHASAPHASSAAGSRATARPI